ncbi:MAG TPA: response regulator transcription factor, partial [Roseiarcus sp.]|nr:response regulator transcription factor [Roseiarcus sp.]
ASEIGAELKRHGFAPQILQDKRDALRAAFAEDAAVIVLDRLLLGEDSLELVETMRKRGVVAPIVIISASESAEERIRGLRAGADDYLVKPFALGELMARIDAIARRLGDNRATRLKAGPLEMDLIEQSVRRDGRPIELLPREFKILEYFMRHPGEVVTREALLEHVWRYRSVRLTNTVDVHLSNLRRKLDVGADRPLIVNKRRAGFVLRTD